MIRSSSHLDPGSVNGLLSQHTHSEKVWRAVEAAVSSRSSLLRNSPEDAAGCERPQTPTVPGGAANNMGWLEWPKVPAVAMAKSSAVLKDSIDTVYGHFLSALSRLTLRPFNGKSCQTH